MAKQDPLVEEKEISLAKEGSDSRWNERHTDRGRVRIRRHLKKGRKDILPHETPTERFQRERDKERTENQWQGRKAGVHQQPQSAHIKHVPGAHPNLSHSTEQTGSEVNACHVDPAFK